MYSMCVGRVRVHVPCFQIAWPPAAACNQVILAVSASIHDETFKNHQLLLLLLLLP
jgi:hypothetical protein